ncbi:50S ribosomal protein L24 [Candidatus Venteria ishoeyi]|uniref:Large ribosomal subunit protein uL24 n=1 Tax=Candidatus Venteria ishoeyi TaxID=1899563 RepID=A0A1H6F9I2_9GAMM|nr:50S ribosomal protein L24 [Candidatus Venteria ishoeyi]MDM8545911.1 50S ribosomal protein L24 [Candidatus Venteria ishoeyi]SEH05969.1 50S ribosomal protein L24 [Candidatus Venteria ishoeyi]
MRRIKQGDDVIVIAGKDKGKQGKVTKIVDSDRVIVEGINLAKRHTKSNPATGSAGGIVEKEMPLNISNVGLYNPATNKADRVGFKTLEDGKKVRYFKSNNEVVDI